MIVYIDKNNKCHTENDGTMTAFETDYFDGKCPAYIEGYCCEVTESSVAYYPWRDLALLEEFQAQYEAQQAETEQLKAELADADAALAILGVTVDE